ncbi:MAG TPA: L,D-transpeptidase [Acidimicrobiales bacterium]|nr:L,D-transpeptidase [Acidimicrobiales bacterium]
MTARMLAAALLVVTVAGCGGARRTAVKALPPSLPSTTTTTTPVPESPVKAFGLQPWSTVVAYASGPSVAAYATPPGAAYATPPGSPPAATFTNPNNLGAPLVFRVTLVMGSWLQVMLPQRPNGSTGWIPASAVKLYNDDYNVVVHLASHTLLLFKNGQQIEAHPVITGSAAAPTVPGDFYITELLKAPNNTGPYGPYAFGLSDFSNTYSEFEGGPGQIAIHGTNQPNLIGQSVSHGCVRVTDDVDAHLAEILPVGSPVLITT